MQRPTRPVTYRCEWCGQERTEARAPGPPPRYCPECKHEAQNALAAGRMRRRRVRLAGRDSEGPRMPRGRPPKG